MFNSTWCIKIHGCKYDSKKASLFSVVFFVLSSYLLHLFLTLFFASANFHIIKNLVDMKPFGQGGPAMLEVPLCDSR